MLENEYGVSPELDEICDAPMFMSGDIFCFWNTIKCPHCDAGVPVVGFTASHTVSYNPVVGDIGEDGYEVITGMDISKETNDDGCAYEACFFDESRMPPVLLKYLNTRFPGYKSVNGMLLPHCTSCSTLLTEDYLRAYHQECFDLTLYDTERELVLSTVETVFLELMNYHP